MLFEKGFGAVSVVVISVDAFGRIIAEQISGIVEGALGLLLIKLEVVVVAWWNIVLLVVVLVIGLIFGSGLSLWCSGGGNRC